MMLVALLKGLTLLKEQAFWRVTCYSLLITVAAFISLYVTVWVVLSQISVANIWWLDTVVEVLGGLAVLALTWLLFPAVATLVISSFLDHIISVVERQYYPHLPTPRPITWWQSVVVALKFAAVMVLLNLLILPLYLVPVLNVVAFYGVNAYLLGREYLELVMLRRLSRLPTQRLRRQHWLRWWSAGLVIAGLLTLPVLNLVAPLVAAAFMVHLTYPFGFEAKPAGS